MEISFKLIYLSSFPLILTWVLIEVLKRKRDTQDEELKQRNLGRKFTRLTKIIIVSNILISSIHLAFCFLEFRKLKTISIESFFLAVTWILITFFVFYSKRRENREVKRWSSVLIFWWVFSCILDTFSVFIFFFSHLKSKPLPDFLPEADTVDVISFPLSSLLCFTSLCFNYTQELQEIETPLLQKEGIKFSANVSHFEISGIWSKLTFRWLNSLLELGRSQKLEIPDIPSVPESETAEKSFSIFQESLWKEKNKASGLSKAILHAIWIPLTINAVFAGMNTLASYLGPFLITNFVNFLSGERDESSHWYGLSLAFIFFAAKTVESLSQRQWYFGARRIGIRIRAALIVSIYKKSLFMKYSGSNNGRIINLIDVDVERIGDFFWYIHGVWLLPFQVFLALIILYKNLGGGPTLAALLSTVFIILGNTPLANIQKKLHAKIMEAKDLRMKSTSETLKSMRVLKLYSWENKYLKKLLELREIERSWLKRYLYTCSGVAFLFWASPTVVSLITFGVCIAVKTPLTSGTVLSALATFRILQEPMYNLPELISMIAQTKVSIDRIQAFIGEEDQKKLASNYTSTDSNIAIEIETGEYSWETSNQNSKKPMIKISENMKIMKGSKVAVCGSVGSGKSSLLCSILSEIPRTSGVGIKVYGSKAYVPQSAWIQTGTIRENVLFGKEMNIGFYEDILEGCSLNKDIEMWADGDLCVVGERGINLSGGQKQRIQLARAVYSDSEVYLLDDPFSAVDAHTGAHLFKECLMGLLSQKTVIYVTHQLEFLDASDLVLVMRDGNIVQSGKYKDLIADINGELVKQMTAHSQSLSQVTTPNDHNFFTSELHHRNHNELKEEKLDDPNDNIKFSNKSHEEETESGRVKWWVYSAFVTTAFKGGLVPVILLCQVLFQGLQIASNYWIAWATEENERVSKEKLIGVFALLSGGSSIFILGRAVLLSTIAIETSRRLFLGMTTSIFRAPISFFDSTPSSRILNRSSTDQSTVDTDIPYRLAGLAFALIQLLSIIILMCLVAWPVFIIFLLILTISVWYQAYYITTARELARMVAIRKAPILHHFSESIVGSVTIRCFDQEDRFLDKNLGLVNDYSRLIFYNSASMEWLCVRINFLFNLVFFLILLILVFLPRTAIDLSLAGLVVTYGLNLNILQAWVIWNLCNVENKMISVERILKFSNIPSEAPLVIQDCKPGPDWPSNGTIELENLHVQYRPSLPLILKGVTCIFPGGKKIGVVGRTGSGKSTLIQTLFRVVEPSEGTILIDKVDISKIGLEDLRSRLSIIPQDPMLFQGSVRTNLDPLQQHSDLEIWEALNKCQLTEIVKQDQRLLDAPVSDDGENWSLGQRQLVCLARVLLKKRKIVVLDEATASVDTGTDNVIQKTIREDTSNRTVITVAHRIPTVIDNDLVLVLDEGKIVEFDSPAELLRDKSSALSKLVMEFLKRSSKSNHH